MEADTPLMDSGNAPEEAVVRIYPELLFSIMLTRGDYWKIKSRFSSFIVSLLLLGIQFNLQMPNCYFPQSCWLVIKGNTDCVTTYKTK